MEHSVLTSATVSNNSLTKRTVPALLALVNFYLINLYKGANLAQSGIVMIVVSVFQISLRQASKSVRNALTEANGSLKKKYANFHVTQTLILSI